MCVSLFVSGTCASVFNAQVLPAKIHTKTWNKSSDDALYPPTAPLGNN